MKTASWGSENSWSLEFQKDMSICTSVANTKDETNYRHFCRLCNGMPFKFYCHDSFGDGWEISPTDDAYVEIENKKYCHENFGSGYSLPLITITIDRSDCLSPKILKSDGTCVTCTSDHEGINTDKRATTPLTPESPHIGCDGRNPICDESSGTPKCYCTNTKATCEISTSTSCDATGYVAAPTPGTCKCGNDPSCSIQTIPTCLKNSDGTTPDVNQLTSSCQVFHMFSWL